MKEQENIKRILYNEQDGKCFHCEEDFLIKDSILTRIIRKSLSNTDSLENFILTCKRCHLYQDNKAVIYEIEFNNFISKLLKKRKDFKNINREVFIPGSSRFRGDIVGNQKVNGKWRKILIELKSFSTFTSTKINSIINQFLLYKSEFDEDVNLIFAFPGVLRKEDYKIFELNKIEVWDRDFIATNFKNQIDKADDKILKRVFSLTTKKSSYKKELIEGLKNIKKGKTEWSVYQKHVEKIINYLFGSILSSSISESSDKFRINRRDIILRNYSDGGFWKYLREKYQADFIVIDTKNYTNKIKKNQILQISNYLKKHGTGLFAIIIARTNEESKGAYFTRKEKWITENKMIIILDDIDLEKMILTKSNFPEEIIKQRIEEFRLEI